MFCLGIIYVQLSLWTLGISNTMLTGFIEVLGRSFTFSHTPCDRKYRGSGIVYIPSPIVTPVSFVELPPNPTRIDEEL